ncbi:uncharacterized protein [Periplaneta americana]|uniref:uncharacterized protein n=1 Tax=Periplaneta americana TaxID=6978 RepID=UPI0037E8E449
MRKEAWEEIGREMNISAMTGKEIWEKLRKSFLQAMNRRRNKKSGQAARKFAPWKFEQQMSFLLPYLENRKTHDNLEDLQEEPQDEPEDDPTTEISESQPAPHPSPENPDFEDSTSQNTASQDLEFGQGITRNNPDCPNLNNLNTRKGKNREAQNNSIDKMNILEC